MAFQYIQSPSQITEGLKSTDRELNDLSARFGAGEPPSPPSLRNRITSLVKRRLYRLLWWQSYQTQELAALMLRRGREETLAIEGLAQNVCLLNQQLGQVHQLVDSVSQRLDRLPQQMEEAFHLVFECRRQFRENERRLEQLEAAQSTLQQQALGVAQEAFRQELIDLKEDVKSLRARTADLAPHEILAFKEKIGQLTQGIDLDAPHQKELAARVSELTHRIDSGTAQQDRLLARLSELGMFT